MGSLFLYCFLVGFGLTVASVLLGAADLGDGDLSLDADGPPNPFTFNNLVAFAMGFGGVGYLVWRFLPSPLAWLGIPPGVVGGVFIAILLNRFMRFLKKGERPLPASSSYEGLLGQLTVGIQQGGTGEVVYWQQGSRMVSGARSHSGEALPKGTEVVILQYEGGIAYVAPIREEEGG